MPSFFLTVRFPVTPLTGDRQESSDAPPSSHEEQADVFYQTDTQVVAEKLLELLQQEWSSETEPPQFDFVSDADMGSPQRVEFRESADNIAATRSLGFDPGVWEYAEMPHDERTVRLVHFHYRAEQLEPYAHEEIGMDVQNTERPLGTAPTNEAKSAAMERTIPEGEPDGGAGRDAEAAEVEAWLFTDQNSVAVRVERILKNWAARKMLTNVAGRTWQQVSEQDGQAQQLWRRLGQDLESVAQGSSEGLDKKVDFAPKGLLAGIFPPQCTCRRAAAISRDWCRSPLAIKADLIFPYHRAWGLLPVDKAVWLWTKLPHAKREAVLIPPVGDFLAALVVNRLGMMVSLHRSLADEALAGRPTDEFIGDLHCLDKQLQAVRNELWDTPDAKERTEAMALLQTYLASESYRSGFEADWSAIPWPAKPENMSLSIYDRREDRDLFPTLADRFWTRRNHALSRTFREAMKTHPGDVANIVKAGLEWLASKLTAMGGTKEQPWSDDAPEYLPASEAHKLIDGQFSLQTLGRLCKPDGAIRYMQKGQRRKLHLADFLRYMKGQQSDPKWAAAYMNHLQGQKAGKVRLFWKCKNSICAHVYPDNGNAPDCCPKCKGEIGLALRHAPKPTR